MLSIGKNLHPHRLWKSAKKYHSQWILLLGMFAVGGLSFEAGFLNAASQIKAPLRIELAPEVKTSASSQSSIPESKTLTAEEQKDTSVLPKNTDSPCVFVASRNSKLYHLATCTVVKRIKPENKLCFKDANEAIARGLKAGCTK